MNPTSNSNDSKQSLPQVNTFQFSNDAVGQVKDSVNLFNGTANLPINIASLPGRKDLDVNIGIMYGSHVQNSVQNWNLTNPTGILGLGWAFPIDQVVVNKNGSGTQSSDQYYLLSNGAGNQLVQDAFIPASPANILQFQMRNFEFWSIQYDASQEKWTVIKEDGTVYIYGDKNSGRNTLQYGVVWGNWLGDAATVIGQEQYVTSWNLSEIQNTWGEKVTYTYDNVEVKTGDATGLAYTQASYLKVITDSFGRTVNFVYGEKYGAQNPGTKNIVEYQAAHTQKPSPNAYQEQYETRFLQQIDVNNTLGTLMFSILFEYDFINLGVPGQANVYPLMWKRVLTSFWQVQPNGKSLPGMEFEYYKLSTDINPGALSAVTYPQGAKAVYNYKQQPLNTSRNLQVNSPMQGATPRVWFGDDYTVVTWYNAPAKKLQAIVYSWCGNWITFELNSDQPTQHYFDNVDFDINTLNVITRQDFIALSFTEKATKQLRLFLYRRNPENFGVFSLSGGPQYMPVNSATASVGVTAGRDFVIAFGKDMITNPVYGYQWNWKQKRWDVTPANNPGPGYIPILLPSPADVSKASNLVITAKDNYYIAALYTRASSLLQFQFFYHDGNNTWAKSALYNTPNVKIYQDTQNPTDFPFSLSPSNAFATATYVNSITSTEVAYSIRILQWDKSFNLLSPSAPLVRDGKSPVSNGKSQFSVFNTMLSNALVNNNPYLNRYIGGPGNSNNVLNWKQANFITQPADVLAFISGQDIAIMSKTQGTAALNQYFQFNPNYGNWGTVQNIASTGTNPTIGGNYLTAGRDVFYQDTNGNWIKLSQQLNSLAAPETVQNRGASYIAYQDNTTANAQTYFVAPINGMLNAPVALPNASGSTGQKIMVQQDQVKPGTLLAGNSTFATYPANQSFDQAASLTLYRVVDGQATGFVQVTPVAYLEIANQYNAADNYYQSYDYASSAQSIITYDGQNNLAQFPKVTVVTGSKIPNAGSAPAGISISYFSNGVASQGEVPYTNNWVYNYNLLLNGALLQKVQYSKQGIMVSRETNYWQIFQSNLATQNYLYGAFFRLSRSISLKDGVTQTTSMQYYQDLGLTSSASTSFVDSNGNTKTATTVKTYAIQVSEYGQAMKQQHLLNAIAQEVSYVTGDAGVQKYTSSKVVTWKNWANDGSWKWSAYQQYQWLGPADNTPDFNFSPSAQRPGWLKQQEVLSRMLPYNVITESTNIDSVSSSYIYDQQGRFQIAEFPAASRQGDEASYYGFEPYESADGWQLGSNASIIPNEDEQVIDAKIGRRSLKINNGTGIQRQFTPHNQQQDYVFSSYVKLPDGFNSGSGAANWVISFSKQGSPVGTDIVLPFGSIIGDWQYLYTIISLKDLNPTGADAQITITIKAQNNNTAAAVLVDTVRFSPLQTLFAAVAVDTTYFVVDAALGANGEIRRKFFDDFQRIVAATGFSDETTSIASSYFSRTGNDNQFSTTDPNSKLRVLASGGGSALSFTRGNEWQQTWAAGSGATWQAKGGELQGQGTLTSKTATANQYGILANVLPLEALTQPLGIKVGSAFTVQWDPATGQWQLLNNSGSVLQQKKIYDFDINGTAALTAENSLAALMRPKLLRRGTNIGHQSDGLIQQVANGIYDEKYKHFYAVQQNGNTTTVSGVGNQWLLLVAEKSLFFFVDGQLIFNYVSAAVISGAASVFAGNNISLGYLLTSLYNQVTFTAANEAGNDIQSQLLEDTRVTVIGNIYDNQGRIIANTKPAYITAAQTPLFRYCSNFAVYNSTNGTISGLVNDAYPDDAGYPYFGTLYEASPVGRVIESSMPGVDYKLGANTQKLAYGANDGNFGLPAGEFYKTTVTDQNGNVTYSLTDQRGQEVRKISHRSETEEIVAAVYYDDAGNPVEMHSPNYQDGDPDKDNWVTTNQYNFIGQLIGMTSKTAGAVSMIYDNANRLRFRQDAQGAAQGNYQYYKYDSVGRILETGYITGTWNGDTLQDMADHDPSYPTTPPTWRLQVTYDYDGTNNAPYQLGQVVKALSNNGNSGTADVEETFAYDIFGNVKTRGQKVQAFEDTKYATGFTYNNLGGITQIDYPVGTGTAYSVYYQYNTAGQITGIGNSPTQRDNMASYTYNAAGKPDQEVLNPYNGHSITRNYAYNSPVWLKETTDSTNEITPLFGETIKTTATGGSPAYYNGQPAELSFTYHDPVTAGGTFTNWYNGLNALQKVSESGPAVKDGANDKTYSFDNNGNFNTVGIAGGTYQYNAEPGKGDRLQTVTDKTSGNTLFGFQYNQNGAVSEYTAQADASNPAQHLQFQYDAGTRMTTQVTDVASSKTTSLIYGSSNQRLLKQQDGASTLYVKSLSGNTIVQVRKEGGVNKITCIVYGPVGMIAFERDGVQYNTLKDHLGSVRLILDSNAAITAAYDYDMYGNVQVLNEPEAGFFPYLYTSQEYDVELGIYNFKARFYFSRVGRFAVVDNYNQFYSPYIYAGNNPVLYIDPTGNFSIGNFFSALAGAIIGVVEILIGVVIDVVAGILEVVTGGLATPASIGLAMLSGAFIGSGVSAVSYSAVSLVTNEFSWKEYGINTAVGFVAGGITAGFGAVGSIAAEAATGVKAAGDAATTLAKVANASIKGAFTVAGGVAAAETSQVITNAANGQALSTGLGETLVSSILSSTLSWAIPGLDYKAGWGNLFKRVGVEIAKSEIIGIGMQLGTNAVHGDSLSTGLLNTVVGGFVSGSVGNLGTNDFGQEKAKEYGNFMNFTNAGPTQPVGADGIIRL